MNFILIDDYNAKKTFNLIFVVENNNYNGLNRFQKLK